VFDLVAHVDPATATEAAPALSEIAAQLETGRQLRRPVGEVHKAGLAGRPLPSTLTSLSSFGRRPDVEPTCYVLTRARVRKFHLGLDPGAANNPKAGCVRRGVLQQPGLPHPRVATHDQQSARPLSGPPRDRRPRPCASAAGPAT